MTLGLSKIYKKSFILLRLLKSRRLGIIPQAFKSTFKKQRNTWNLQWIGTWLTWKLIYYHIPLFYKTAYKSIEENNIKIGKRTGTN